MAIDLTIQHQPIRQLLTAISTISVVGRGSLVLNVTYLVVACHKIEPSTAEDPSCRGAMPVNSVESSNILPLVGVVFKREGCRLRCRPRHLNMAQRGSCLPGAAVPATPSTGITPINYQSGFSTDTITPSLRSHCSSFLLIFSGVAALETSFVCVRRRRKEAEAEDPRHLSSRPFKLPGDGWQSIFGYLD
ncbi:hypothetical protein TNCV_191141 [Trichonephila clavipes]|nr:hypothetical protein TNCV_191141 [Trichonephila clavipes]